MPRFPGAGHFRQFHGTKTAPKPLRLRKLLQTRRSALHYKCCAVGKMWVLETVHQLAF
jgi:hypothetical protein